MKMTRVTRFVLIALAVSLAAWVVLTLVTNSPTEIRAPENPAQCPECGMALPKEVREGGGECPYCKALGKATVIGQRKGPDVLRGPTVPIALLATAGLLLLVHLVFLVRNRARGQREEVLYYMNCRKCLRKIRYRERQVGQLAKCPLCHALIRFPEPEGAHRARWPAALLGKILGR